mmetsp:Transcript_35748/g.95007  ORF Transcript_35748/g.95007 Transcript_35748/m.95007 type:complete len:403 (+) Transcript_35748:400-1608(+)
MLQFKEIVVESVLLDLTLHLEDLNLVLALRLRQTVKSVRSFLDDLLENVGRACLGTLVLRDLERMNRYAALRVKIGVGGVDRGCDAVQLLHKLLQSYLRHVFDEKRTCLVVHVTRQIPSEPHHFRQIHHLPEHGDLQNELHVIERTTVEFKPHVLWAGVETLDAEISLLATQSTAPVQTHHFVIRLQKERTRQVFRTVLGNTVVIMHLAILVFHDHRFMILKFNHGTDICDDIVWSRNEQLLFGGKTELPRACVANQNRMLFVHLHTFFFAAIKRTVIRTQEDSINTTDNAHLSSALVLNLYVFVNLQINCTEFVSIEELLVSARENNFLATMHRHLARHTVQQTDVLERLQCPSLLLCPLNAPCRFEKEKRLPSLHPTLSCRFIFDPHKLILLQCYCLPYR